MDILHIWGQEAFHDDAYIVGNKASLVRLRDLLNEAINTGYASGDDFMVNDGEGYSIAVTDIPIEMIDKVAVPYTRYYAKERRKDAVYPWGTIREDKD